MFLDNEKLFLSNEQIEFITERPSKKCQIKVLRQNGVKFFLSAEGRPKVLLSEYESKFGPIQKIKNSKHNQPNYQALEQAMGING